MGSALLGSTSLSLPCTPAVRILARQAGHAGPALVAPAHVAWDLVQLQELGLRLGCFDAPAGLARPRPTPAPARHAHADAFRQCPLFIGGPVTKNLLHVLHARRDVEGALEIIEVCGCVCGVGPGTGVGWVSVPPRRARRLPLAWLPPVDPCMVPTAHHAPLAPLQGVFAGGVESASELVRRGEASPKDFMLLSGYSGWGPGQLQQVGSCCRTAAAPAVLLQLLPLLLLLEWWAQARACDPGALPEQCIARARGLG